MTRSAIKNVLVVIATIAVIVREMLINPYNLAGEIIAVASIIVLAVLFIMQREKDITSKSDIYLLLLVVGLTGGQLGSLMKSFDNYALIHLRENIRWLGLLFLVIAAVITFGVGKLFKKTPLVKRLAGSIALTIAIAYTLGGNLNIYDYCILIAIDCYYLFTATLNDTDPSNKTLGRSYWLTLITMLIVLLRRLVFPGYELSSVSLLATLNFEILPFYFLGAFILISIIIIAIEQGGFESFDQTNDSVLFCGLASFAAVSKCCVYFHFYFSWTGMLICVLVLIAVASRYVSEKKKAKGKSLYSDDWLVNPLSSIVVFSFSIGFSIFQLCQGHYFFLLALGIAIFIVFFLPDRFSGWHKDFAKSFAITFSLALIAGVRVLTVGYSLKKELLIAAVFVFVLASLYFVDHNNHIGHNDFKYAKGVLIVLYGLLLIIPVYKGGTHIKIEADEDAIKSNYLINPTNITINVTADGKKNSVESFRYVFSDYFSYDKDEIVEVKADKTTIDIDGRHLIVWAVDSYGIQTKKDFWFDHYKDPEAAFNGSTFIKQIERMDAVRAGQRYKVYDAGFNSKIIEVEWFDYNDAMIKPGVYDGRVRTMAFSIEVDPNLKDQIYYAYYYSLDAEFDIEDLKSPIVAAKTAPKMYGERAYYDIDCSVSMDKGYYAVIVASDESLKDPYILAYAEVGDRTEPLNLSPASNDQNRSYVLSFPGNIMTYTDGFITVDNSLFEMNYSELKELANGNLTDLEDWSESDLDTDAKCDNGPIAFKFKEEMCIGFLYHYSENSFDYKTIKAAYISNLGECDSVLYDNDTGFEYGCVWRNGDTYIHLSWNIEEKKGFVEYELASSVIED